MCCGDEIEEVKEPITLIGWRAYYGDFSVYSSKDAQWVDLPADGLQRVNVYQSNMTSAGFPYRYNLGGYDCYFKFPTPEGCMFAGSNDPPDEVEERYPGAIVKRGKWVHLARSQKIEEMASKDRWP